MPTPTWIVQLTKFIYPWRFHLAGLTRLPMVGSMINRWLFAGDQVIYLPRDQHITVSQPLDAESVVLPSSVVDYFIRQSKYHFVMSFCICRVSGECSDFPQDLGCLFLGEAVLKINPKFGRLVSQEEALAHVQKARQAGLLHTIGKTRMDAVWLGAGPTHKLLTICHCCRCCCLWNVVPQFTPQIGRKISRMPGLLVQVNEDCTACGACLRNICFMDAIRLEDGKAHISEECRGCGRCIEACPQIAIELQVVDSGFVEETIRCLDALTDLD